VATVDLKTVIENVLQTKPFINSASFSNNTLVFGFNNGSTPVTANLSSALLTNKIMANWFTQAGTEARIWGGENLISTTTFKTPLPYSTSTLWADSWALGVNWSWLTSESCFVKTNNISPSGVLLTTAPQTIVSILMVISFPSPQTNYVLFTQNDGGTSQNWYIALNSTYGIDAKGTALIAASVVVYIDGINSKSLAPTFNLGDGQYHSILITGVTLTSMVYQLSLGREIQNGPKSWPIGTKVKALATWKGPTMSQAIVTYNHQMAQTWLI
jgi:hypothetical protein